MMIFTPMRLYRLLFAILLASAALQGMAAQPATGTEHPFVVSGVVVNSGNAKLINLFVRNLSEQSHYPMKPVFVNSYRELSRLLRERPDAIAWTCAVPFVEDHKAYGQQLVGVPLFNGQPLYHSLVLARRGSPETRLADFKDKVLAYSDPRSNSGFVAPAYTLRQQGIDITEHFRLLINTGSHERSIEALLSGLADVAAVDEYIWVEYQRTHPKAANVLHELERMGPFPFTPIVAGPKVRQVDIEGLQNALTNLTETPDGRSLLDWFGLDGFVRKTPAFYDPIEKMLKAANSDDRLK